MRFFKHLSTAHEDEALAALLEEMGAEAYGIYWRLLEHFAAAMPRQCERVPEIVQSVIQWSHLCRCSTRKFNKFCDRATKLRLICVETASELRQFSSKRVAKRLQICIPKLLKYRDEHQKNGPFFPQKSRQKGQVELELELELRDSTLCRDTVSTQIQCDASDAESTHTPPTLSSGNENGNENLPRNGQRKPALATLPDWERLCTAARKAGMVYDPSPQGIAGRSFRLLTLPERIAAIEGIHKRIGCGEYDPAQPGYTHTLENYLTRKIWQQGTRPQTRGQPKRRPGAALERLVRKAEAGD